MFAQRLKTRSIVAAAAAARRRRQWRVAAAGDGPSEIQKNVPLRRSPWFRKLLSFKAVDIKYGSPLLLAIASYASTFFPSSVRILLLWPASAESSLSRQLGPRALRGITTIVCTAVFFEIKCKGRSPPSKVNVCSKIHRPARARALGREATAAARPAGERGIETAAGGQDARSFKFPAKTVKSRRN